MLLAQSCVAASEGSLREVLSLARQAAELAAAQHQLAAEVCALHTAVRFGDRTVADRPAELACQVDGPRACAAAAHAAALAADDGPRTARRLDPTEEMGAAQRCKPHRQRLRRPAGSSLKRRPHSRTLAGTAPLPISTREREVATMVATGLANRQIAARLHVSIRTVEGHIYRACTR